MVLVLLTGCGINKEEAREELAKLNISYSPNDFVKAAENNDMRVVDLFIKSGMEPNVQNDNGQTALLNATMKENAEMVKLLINEGADPTIQNNDGENALIYATIKPSLGETLKLFLEDKKLDLNKTFFGYNLAMIAAQEPNKSAFDQIIQKKIDIKIKNTQGESLLHSAVKGKDLQIIKDVLSMGVDPNQSDSKGITPLAIAVKNGDSGAVKMLLQRKADPKVRALEGGKLLTVSISKGYDKITRELQNKGANTASLLAFPIKENKKNAQLKNIFGKSPLLTVIGTQDKETDITFHLGGRAKTLAFNFSNGHGTKTSFFNPQYDTKFKILGDGKVLLTSDSFSITSPQKVFSVNVLGVNDLTISTEILSDQLVINGKSKISNPEVTLLN
ncbi:ankyrin repeat domain-containing protein [Neobacillus niacini]|uniref:ankyrin repeat domain-containing protein n=1 Tax=Neobacillus niacini TaxID=86668 RepID=UPI003B587F94